MEQGATPKNFLRKSDFNERALIVLGGKVTPGPHQPEGLT